MTDPTALINRLIAMNPNSTIADYWKIINGWAPDNTQDKHRVEIKPYVIGHVPPVPKVIPKMERIFVPDKPKEPYVRPKAEYTNIKSKYF